MNPDPANIFHLPFYDPRVMDIVARLERIGVLEYYHDDMSGRKFRYLTHSSGLSIQVNCGNFNTTFFSRSRCQATFRQFELYLNILEETLKGTQRAGIPLDI